MDQNVSDSEISDDSTEYIPESCHGSSSAQDSEDDSIPDQPCSDDESTYTTTASNTQTFPVETDKSSSTETLAAWEGSSCTQKDKVDPVPVQPCPNDESIYITTASKAVSAETERVSSST